MNLKLAVAFLWAAAVFGLSALHEGNGNIYADNPNTTFLRWCSIVCLWGAAGLVLASFRRDAA